MALTLIALGTTLVFVAVIVGVLVL